MPSPIVHGAGQLRRALGHTAVACDDEVHEDTSEELAIHAAKDFLGIDMSCVSCHNGARHLEKINLYLSQRQRSELWQMGAFFGKTRVMRRTEITTAQDEVLDRRQGPGFDPSARTVLRVDRRGPQTLLEPAYVHGREAGSARHPRAEFARMLTADRQFARATVNLLWWEMFGVGIVDPPFSWDLAPRSKESASRAVDAAAIASRAARGTGAVSFIDNSYSLRSVITLIAKSSAYQLSSWFPGEWKELRAVSSRASSCGVSRPRRSTTRSSRPRTCSRATFDRPISR